MQVEIRYFSATGTTKKIVKAFTKGLAGDVRMLDFTSTEKRKDIAKVASDLVVLAVPVYGERIPRFIYPYLKKLQGNGKPLVVISIFGNMGFGISLEQFADLAKKNNFKLIGAGAFVGEHSYANNNIPVGFGRPDAKDLAEATFFGQQIQAKLDTGDLQTIEVPASTTPMILTHTPDFLPKILLKQPKVDHDICTNCQACVVKCPMSAIDQETLKINEKSCLRCFACVKVCPEQARRHAFALAPFSIIFIKMGVKPKANQVIV